MKTVGIVAALKNEIQFIKEKLLKYKKVYLLKTPFYQGYIGNVHVILLECGIGKVNAAIHTQMLIDKFEVEAIINIGTAGGLDDNIPQFSVVIADQITYFDVSSDQLAHCYPYRQYFIADKELIKILAASSEQLTTKIGHIITGDAFISDGKKKEELFKAYHALCVEMEGAAIAQTAYINGIPFGAIRCISDFANESSTVDYKLCGEQAAQKVAQMVYETILKLQ